MSAEPAPTFSGLTSQEAQERIRQHGPNELATTRRRTIFHIIAHTLREPMFLLLILAAGIYLVIGDLGEGLFLCGGAAMTIGLVVLQEARSENALAALRAMAAPQARVVRDGVEATIAARDLVPGDIVLVGEGNRIPADGTLRGGDVLTIDESILTGESTPVFRTPLAPGSMSVLSAGTLIVGGNGWAEVTATGESTRLGRIGRSLSEIYEQATALQKSSARVIMLLAVVGIFQSVVIFLGYGVLRGEWLAGALTGLTLAIALLPEEFPMVLAIFMALGAWRLARHNVLVRRTAAVEALGGVTLLCVDKTGTLTRNRMQLAFVWADGAADPVEVGRSTDEASREVLRMAMLASAARSTDPMDQAVLKVAKDLGISESGSLSETFPLRPERLAVIQVWRSSASEYAAAKGAPETIFRMCGLDAPSIERQRRAIEMMAKQGLRVLGIASASMDGSGAIESRRFRFLGLIGFIDPLRDDVPVALQEARGAGISVAMITGDHPSTALEIARQAGIDVSGGVITGAELDRIDDQVLRQEAMRVRVFARIGPEQKLRLVRIYQQAGETVAMTGDGVNDGPALQAADIGIAMGQRGSDIAREASDIILLDDSFSSIIGGVRLGRRIFANLRRALTFIVAVHVPLAGLAFVPLVAGWPPLLLPMHVVLLELAIDPVCSLVFESEPSETRAMLQPPRRTAESLFGRRQLLPALLQGLGILLAIAVFYGWSLSVAPEAEARGAAFAGLVAASLVLAIVNASAGSASFFHHSHTVFWAISGIALGIVAAAFAFPPFGDVLDIAPPAGGLLAAAACLSIVSGGWYGLWRGLALHRVKVTRA